MPSSFSRSNLDVPADFKTEYFQRASDERVEAAIARTDATFEQIRLRSMAKKASKYALRVQKQLEANEPRDRRWPGPGQADLCL